MNRAKENIAKVIDSFKTWYRTRLVRRVFLVGLLIAAVITVIATFTNSYVMMAAMLVCGIAIMASVIDTWISMREFKIMVKQVDHDFKMREETNVSCFTPQDRADIRRKRMQFIGAIILKLMFIVILIALMVQISV